jgi:hypothetical protein
MSADVSITGNRRKALIVVHGMGSPKKHSVLFTVTNAIANWMDLHGTRPNNNTLQPEIEETPRAEGPGEVKDEDQNLPPSRVVLSFENQKWLFVEVWWARSFDAPLFDPMIGWTVRRFVAHLTALAWSLVIQSLGPLVLLPSLLLLSLPVIVVAVLASLTVLLVWALVILPYWWILKKLWRPGVSLTALKVNYALYGFMRLAIPLLGLAFSVLVPLLLIPGAIEARAVTGFVIFGVLVSGGSSLSRILRVYPTRFEGALIVRQLMNTPGIWDAAETGINLPGRNSPWNPLFYFVATASAIKFVYRPFSNALKQVDENLILARIGRTERWTERIGLVALLTLLVIFDGLNALVNISLYLGGVFLIVPAMFLVWVLSLVGGIPRVPALVNFIKGRLDSFLVGSLGDIKVFMDEPVQAKKIRHQLERALDNVHGDLEFNGADIYILAHSTGAAISYETLVLESNSKRRKGVRGLITVGSIMRMVWSVRSRRTSFNAPPPGIVWTNFWTRYDPALAGPVIRHRSTNPVPISRWVAALPRPLDRAGNLMVAWGKSLRSFVTSEPQLPGGMNGGELRVEDVPVSNEGDAFNDHSTYWQNDHQVIPRIVSQVWGDDAASYFDFGNTPEKAEQKKFQRLKKRKYRILLLAIPRLALWYLFPFSLYGVIADGRGIPSALRFWGWPQTWMRSYQDHWSVELIDDVLLSPDIWWETAVGALVLASLVTLAGQLFYKFLRAIIWDGFLEDRSFLQA